MQGANGCRAQMGAVCRVQVHCANGQALETPGHHSRSLDFVHFLPALADGLPSFVHRAEKQRVAFARALLKNPNILVLDEVRTQRQPNPCAWQLQTACVHAPHPGCIRCLISDCTLVRQVQRRKILLLCSNGACSASRPGLAHEHTHVCAHAWLVSF